MKTEPKTRWSVDASFHTASQNSEAQQSLERYLQMLRAHEEWADTVDMPPIANQFSDKPKNPEA